MKYKLYYMRSCPFCQRVLRFMENKNICDKIELRDINENKDYEEELLKKGKKIQVPCLFIDEEPLYESMDIIEYLDKNFV